MTISILALFISLVSLTFTGFRFFIDLGDRRRKLSEAKPYIVLRPIPGEKYGDEMWVAICNDGSVTAHDVTVVFAVGQDPEATIFTAHARRLDPGEALETTNLAVQWAARGPTHRFNELRIEIGYRLPHSTQKFTITPAMGDYVLRGDRQFQRITSVKGGGKGEGDGSVRGDS